MLRLLLMLIMMPADDDDNNEDDGDDDVGSKVHQETAVDCTIFDLHELLRCDRRRI